MIANIKHIISNFKPQGGYHCISNSLKQIFDFYNYSLSEEMIFGLGKGLHFVYINLSSVPLISGRIKPIEFENNLEKSIGVSIKISQPKKQDIAFEKLKKSILENKPVLLYVDMPYLNYLKLGENSHFGGHSIVVFGFDDKRGVFYVSDRDSKKYPIQSQNGQVGEDYHLVSYNELAKARASKYRPFPANNKWASFDFSKAQPINKKSLQQLIKNHSKNYINAPAKLLGLNGIEKFSKEIRKWGKFDQSKLKFACITNYFMINKKGGTGGGAFRKMYGNFLIEASNIIENSKYAEIGKQYIKVSEQWDRVADRLWSISETLKIEYLGKISELIFDIYNQEMVLQKQLIEIK
jgi:hypothetical protein